MYFVTTKREGYILFCMSPNERFALGLTEDQTVRLFARNPAGEWETLHEWKGADYSHTAFMAALRHRDEPDDPRELLALLPAHVR
jgi:hypothetical protein